MADNIRNRIANTAKSCQKTWGMGFPVISMSLLDPYLDEYQDEIERLRAALEQIADFSNRTIPIGLAGVMDRIAHKALGK